MTCKQVAMPQILNCAKNAQLSRGLPLNGAAAPAPRKKMLTLRAEKKGLGEPPFSQKRKALSLLG